MKEHRIDFSLTGMLTDLVSAYLEENPATKELYRVPLNLNGILHSVPERNFNATRRHTLRKVLEGQYHALQQESTAFEEVKKNIASLEKENTFTITTGHQLNLFTGPLYFIYKIASAVNLAAQLNHARPDCHFVPVYWMASEDHDLEEINHFYIYGKRFHWDQHKDGASGRLHCHGVNTLLERVEEALGQSRYGETAIRLLRKAYDERRTLSEATRILVNELFGKYGLVILDPDNPELKKDFVDIMTDDVTGHHAHTQVTSSITKLEANYKVQVHPREINLFYLGPHSRSRIERKGDGYAILDKDRVFTKEELKEEIKSNPGDFSPNVVLRPLYQEMVLPNLAVIGGPAEIAYWLEYKSMFDYYEVPFPCLVLRGSAMILDSSVQKRMNKLGLSSEDLFKDTEVMVKDYLLHNMQNGFLEDARNRVESVFDSLAMHIAGIDVTLKASAEGEKQKSLKSIQSLEEKVGRALKRKNETAVSQIEKVKSVLFPAGIMQERQENFLSFYSRLGDDFIAQLVRDLNPMAKKFFVFTEE